MKKAGIFVALVLSTLSFRVPAAGAETACLQVGRIWSWKPLNRQTLIVEDELHRKFKVGLTGYCPRLPFKLGLAFKANGAINGLDCIRRGDDVVSSDVGMHYTCPVMSIEPYTPAMEHADRAAAAAKGQSGP